jgi:hypothetical protein
MQTAQVLHLLKQHSRKHSTKPFGLIEVLGKARRLPGLSFCKKAFLLAEFVKKLKNIVKNTGTIISNA